MQLILAKTIRGARKRLFFMTKNQVSLRVAGNEYHGWLSVSVVIALQMLARSFTLSLTTQSSLDPKKQFKVAPGDSVELLIGEDLVVTGLTNSTLSFLFLWPLSFRSFDRFPTIPPINSANFVA